MLAFIYIPVVLKEMDIFRETVWNSHRVRHQRDSQLPKGLPNHIYSFPEEYGAENCANYFVTMLFYLFLISRFLIDLMVVVSLSLSKKGP